MGIVRASQEENSAALFQQKYISECGGKQVEFAKSCIGEIQAAGPMASSRNLGVGQAFAHLLEPNRVRQAVVLLHLKSLCGQSKTASHFMTRPGLSYSSLVSVYYSDTHSRHIHHPMTDTPTPGNIGSIPSG